MIRALLLTLIAAAVLLSCTSSPTNKFSDPNLVTIYEWRDQRLGDSLVRFLSHANPLYRAEACLAFGSIQDSLFSAALGNMLLEDPATDVRAGAAFALGQTPGFASVNSLVPALSDTSSIVVREAVEALGKTISKADLNQLKSFRPKDRLEEEGLAFAIYRLGLRNLVDAQMIAIAGKFLGADFSDATRLAAAHFFARASVKPTAVWKELAKAAQQDANVWVRMAAVSGLRRVENDSVKDVITSCLKTDSDYRVRANAVRALQNFKLNSKTELYRSLDDSNVNVAIASAEVLRQISEASDVNDLKDQVKSSENWRVRTLLMESVIKLDTTYLRTGIDLYSKSTNDYERAWMLQALAKSIHSYGFIANQILTTKSIVIKTSGAQGIASLAATEGLGEKHQQKLAAIFENLIRDGDPGVIAIIAGTLSDPKLNYKSVISDYTFLTEAKNKLSLPKDIETLQPLLEAIAYFEGNEKPAPPKNSYNHPIAWEEVKKIESKQQVLIRTTKGDIQLQLKVNDAPGSVLNFVTLAKSGYFNGKFVHRVVPNFVIQTGCNRGDGFGSEDYSIRSEFSRQRYTEGSVGMASAGKDTEGTQWFITHSPTPHLDGRYTIFAEVSSGMEVVHRIEVGDQIKEVVLLEK